MTHTKAFLRFLSVVRRRPRRRVPHVHPPHAPPVDDRVPHVHPPHAPPVDDRVPVTNFHWSYETIEINGQPIMRKHTTQGKEKDGTGTCVHHASVVCVEARYRRKMLSSGKTDVPWLSVQDAIDGAKTTVITNVLRWMCSTGVTTEHVYPFVGARQGFHMYNKVFDRYTIKNYLVYDPSKDASTNDKLQAHLINEGPFMIVIDTQPADYISSYLSGRVYEGPDNRLSTKEGVLPQPTKLPHFVAVFGEGCVDGVQYWEYLNNWGPYKSNTDGKGKIAKDAFDCAYVPIIN